jgi:hypothetical protein
MEYGKSHELTLRGDGGAEVKVTLPAEGLSGEQSVAVQKLFEQGTPSALTREEWEIIRDLRATTRADLGQNAFIVRFDWKWVRIDEAGLSFEEIQNPK